MIDSVEAGDQFINIRPRRIRYNTDNNDTAGASEIVETVDLSDSENEEMVKFIAFKFIVIIFVHVIMNL